MTRQQQIDEICQTIVREFQPEKLILFGSEAAGTARPDSDIDLLVIMAFSGSSARQASEIYGSIERRSISVDIVVHRPEDIQWRAKEGDVFITEILRTGRVIHEAHHA